METIEQVTPEVEENIIEETTAADTAEEVTAVDDATQMSETEADSSETDVQASAETTEPQTPTWEPNYNYKVRDEELQFDEWAKPFIKDEETYKNFQDLYTRGHGLELAKAERDDYKDRFTTLDTSLQKVNELVEKRDAETFIKALGLPEDMFINYAIEKLKYQELSPEERAQVDAEKQRVMTMQNLQTQNQHLETQIQQTARAQRSMELDQSLAEPSIQTMAQKYDAQVGKPGAFRQVAIERGIFHHQVNGRDLTAQEAVQDAVSLLGLSATGTQQNPQIGNVGTQQPANRVVHKQQQVIPNIQGKGTSPLKKKPKSIDDIIKLRDARLQQQG